MKTKTGLWIDHSKAQIITITENVELVKVIESEVEQQPRDDQQNALTSDLNTFFDKVISYLGNATSILIFGPGEAKGQLKKRMEENKIDDRIAAVETTDSMTDGQLVAFVKEFFKD